MCSSLSISDVVSSALKQLGVTATRRWSGYDFFGLTRSDVVSQITYMQDNLVLDTSSNEKSKQAKVISDIVNVRSRNAGPTSNLCSKSQKQRNELIHKLVAFTTFGDVKGRYKVQFYIYIYIQNSLELLLWFGKDYLNPIQLGCFKVPQVGESPPHPFAIFHPSQ